MRHALPPEAVAAAARGELIEAIKLTREATGLGLKESKDLVDRHVRGHTGSWGDDDGKDAHRAWPSVRRAGTSPHPPTAAGPSRRAGLSPGEVPRGPQSWAWVVGLVAAAVVIYLFVR